MSDTIGAQMTRGWVRIGVKLIHDNKAKLRPDNVMHLPSQNWSLAVAGMRSDGLKVTRVVVLKPEEAKDPAKVAASLEALVRDFETFLNCACGAQPCLQHRDAIVGRSQIPGSPVQPGLIVS